jgi:hypothetical protein
MQHPVTEQNFTVISEEHIPSIRIKEHAKLVTSKM